MMLPLGLCLHDVCSKVEKEGHAVDWNDESLCPAQAQVGRTYAVVVQAGRLREDSVSPSPAREIKREGKIPG